MELWGQLWRSDSGEDSSTGRGGHPVQGHRITGGAPTTRLPACCPPFSVSLTSELEGVLHCSFRSQEEPSAFACWASSLKEMYPVYISGSISFIWMVAKGKQLSLVGLKNKTAFQIHMLSSNWVNIQNLKICSM